ncbi:MAG: hypothetical protein ABSH20_19875, partial [Tepidisphaeraceae bacterium]
MPQGMTSPGGPNDPSRKPAAPGHQPAAGTTSPAGQTNPGHNPTAGGVRPPASSSAGKPVGIVTPTTDGSVKPSTPQPATKPAAAGAAPPGTGKPPVSMAAPGTPGSPGGPGTPGSAPGGMPPIDQLQGRPVGRILTKMGRINRDQLVEALSFQKSKGGSLGRILVDLGYIKEADLNLALAAQKGYEPISLEGVKIPEAAVKAVPSQIATTNKVLPLS